MKKQEIKEIIKLDAQRSKASMQGKTKEFLKSIDKIAKLIRAASRN
mgnify:CR=1 FL=1